MTKIRFAVTTAALILLVQILSAATISGFITRAESAEPLQYVNVRITETRVGMQTNKKGYYVLNISRPGSYTLEVSMIGFSTQRIPFRIAAQEEDFPLNVALEKTGVELQRIVVTAAPEEDNIYSPPQIRIGTIRQNPEDIQKVVAVVEADVFRSVLALPGVTPISDFSAGLYVRGGSPDQNLILLDDIDVYNPNHFGGVFSTFNTDAVESVELIKGGYPAKYGGRLSSVLDVTNRQGNRNYHQGVARLSAISTSATLEGPWRIGGQHGSYMASFRRTYLELMKQFVDLPDYYFYDGHAKLNWDLDSRNKFSASAYFGRDDLTFDFGSELKLDWGNQTFTTQWVRLFNPTLFAHFIIAGSRFESNFSVSNEEGSNSISRHNGIDDLSTKGMLSWKPNNEHQLDFGYELKWNQTIFKMDTDTQYDPNALPDVDAKSLLSAVYAQDVWDINDFWTLQPGFRLSWYKTLSVNLPNSPHASYLNLEPRVSLRRKLDVAENVYVNYGRYYQYLTLMSMEVSTPFDIWYPMDGSLRPGISDHYTVGYKNELSRSFGFDFEVYYKTYRNLLQYNTATAFTWDNATVQLKDTFNTGKGFTYGADFMLRNDWKGFEGFIGYTISKTQRRIENTNIDPETLEPRYFYPKYDRSHQVNIIENFNFTENTGRQLMGGDLKFGLNFTYTTGQPNQVPERIYFDGEDFQIIYSYSDRERLPDYVRLDLSTKLEFLYRWGSIEPYFEIVNVLNRKNVSFRDYNISPDLDTGQLTLNHDDGTQFPFLPFVGVNVKW